MSIGDNIENTRKIKNITQVELANAVGITPSMLCQLERGTKVLSVPLGKKIASYLGVPFSELIDEG